MSKKKKRKSGNKAIVVLTVVFFVAGFYAGGYFSGMRLQNFRFVKSCSITIDNLKIGQKIFLDESSLGNATENGKMVFSGITPGKHNLIVTKNAYWPWAKEITLASSGRVSFNPFLLAQIPNVEILTLDNKNFQNLKDSIEVSMLPSADNPAKSSDGSALLWLDGSSVMVKSPKSPLPEYFCNPDCADTLNILNASTDIKDVSFFPNRSDLVVFSTFEGIFVIEVDGRGIRNFQPLYKGEFINFKVLDDKLYVLVTPEKIYNIIP